MTMTGHETASGQLRDADPADRLKSRIAASNIDNDTFLATDYLNHFNEIVMLLDMIPDMPDILEDAKDWRPKSYARHFNDSGLSDSALTIEAYENAPAEFRGPFDDTIERMNQLVFKSIEIIEAAMQDGRPEELAAAATASRLLQRLIDAAAAIIHGNTPNLDQGEIDDLLAG
ncbi:MAG: hypothetical protein VCD66_16875 [Alphaproteobacteria bacterium]